MIRFIARLPVAPVFVPALALALLASPPAPASQKPCRDAQGRVVKCAKPRAASPRCKDANGRFVKCPDAKMSAKGPAKSG